ncbi:MAG: tetratricopeptide repeat protein [Candidatus Lindowbacteria bacterium]|nr:tetratricopeptide repeat protein [Candidatus Lindowbacteria bacterium]
MTALITILFILALLAISAISLYLTHSGFITGRTTIGWVVVGIYAAVFLTFVFQWLPKVSMNPFLNAAILVFLLMPQGPLVFDLLSQAITPHSSGGMRLVKAYSAAEGKLAQGDLKGAIVEYEKVLANDPKDTVARLRLAELCLQSGEYLKAAAAYETMVAQKRRLSMGSRCSALTMLSEIYAKRLGDIERARKCLQMIVKDYPETKYARYAAERLINLEKGLKK